MKKFVKAMLFDKSGKMVFGYLFKTSTIKHFAGIKHIADLENDVYAQTQLESSIVVDTKQFAKDYADAYGTIIDHILIYNDYTDTVNKYNI